MIDWNFGDVCIGTTTPLGMLTVNNAYCDGTTWVNASHRSLKQDFAPVDPESILEQVISLPLQSWSYKAQPGDKHIGPVAQDFHAAFGLNRADDKHIATVDESGVALAAIQGLNQKLEQKETEITELKQSLEELRAYVRHLSEARKGEER